MIWNLEIWSSGKISEENFPWTSMGKHLIRYCWQVDQAVKFQGIDLGSMFQPKIKASFFPDLQDVHSIRRPQTEDSWEFLQKLLIIEVDSLCPDNKPRLIFWFFSILHPTTNLAYYCTLTTNKVISQYDLPYLHLYFWLPVLFCCLRKALLVYFLNHSLCS